MACKEKIILITLTSKKYSTYFQKIQPMMTVSGFRKKKQSCHYFQVNKSQAGCTTLDLSHYSFSQNFKVGDLRK